ncbi:MAG TPA: ATP-binding protein [Kofleriaceae bacterium]|nr:ATP-binding protein [Kofleriaceae bacterium]
MSLRDRELYQLFDRSPIGMYRVNEAGNFQYVNAALVRMLGYDSVEELLSRNLARDVFADPEERARLHARFRPKGGVDGARVRWRTKQGRERIVQIYGTVIEEPGDPDYPCFDASVLDVTDIETANLELRKQREALETTAAMLDLVVRQMQAVYWVVDRDLRICRSGGVIRELFGIQPGRFLGMTLDQLQRADPVSTDPVGMHRRALIGETVTYTNEWHGKHVVTTVTPHRSNGVIVGAIGTCIDMTTQYMLERRMVDAQRAESLGVLAGGLAHDFNNLLVAILGNADLALRDVGPRGPGRPPLEHIRQAGLRGAELIEQLLAYAGHRGVASTRVSPSPVIDELVRITAPTMPRNIEVRVEIADDLVLRGDASQIRQVLLNLMNNARDALGSRGGTIAITGRLLRHDGAAHPDDVIAAPAGTYVELEIADDGPGMSSETRRRIFEPFFTTKSTGHGLGLAAVAGIVRAHGGGLRLGTAPGEGARFQVQWPSTFTPGELTAVSPPANGHTILIIDDEDLVRDVVARMIEDLGYAAITATDGPAGLAIIDSLPIDAVLVDLTMPRMGGHDVINALRLRRPDLPIVLCSGIDRDVRSIRADAYLPKPFRIEALEGTLARLLPPRSS